MTALERMKVAVCVKGVQIITSVVPMIGRKVTYSNLQEC